jgi:hypothetical protein
VDVCVCVREREPKEGTYSSIGVSNHIYLPVKTQNLNNK